MKIRSETKQSVSLRKQQVASKGIKVIAWIAVDETERTEFLARDHRLLVSNDTDRDLILRYQSFLFQ